MSGCTAAARCCVLRLGLDVSSASSPLTLASWRAFTSRFITSAFCKHVPAHSGSKRAALLRQCRPQQPAHVRLLAQHKTSKKVGCGMAKVRTCCCCNFF